MTLSEVFPEPMAKIKERAARRAREYAIEVCKPERSSEWEDWAVKRIDDAEDTVGFPITDSPIEQILLAAVTFGISISLTEKLMMGIYVEVPGRRYDFNNKIHAKRAFVIERQVFLFNWPVDFVFPLKSGLGLVVECDGHEFHERTPEQAARDRSRDRLLQSAGYTVYRFTGSEIWNDPCGCADQIIAWFSSKEASL